MLRVSKSAVPRSVSAAVNRFPTKMQAFEIFEKYYTMEIVRGHILDECNDFQYVHDHSVDMVVDYREPTLYNLDNGRFKRDMQGGNNTNPKANQFWVVYKTPKGFSKVSLRITYCIYGNYAPEQDRKFYVYSDYRNESSKILLTQFNESQDVFITINGSASPYYYRNYEIDLPIDSYFFEIHFLDWVKGPAGINYWTPQINFVSLTEICDPKCGNGLCGESDSSNTTENCQICPEDCGGCPSPVCDNGFCEYGENWPSPTAEYSTDLGPLTCPQDCGYISACGNGRCDIGEVCRSDSTHSCSADCCLPGNFSINPGMCSNGLCDGNETCETCVQDCGMCLSCGDGVCNGHETCMICPSDCGKCPDPLSCPNLPPRNTTETTTGAIPSSFPSSAPSPTTDRSTFTTTDVISDPFPSQESSEQLIQTLIIVIIVAILGSMLLGGLVTLCLVYQRKKMKLKPVATEQEPEHKDMKSITCSRRSSADAIGQS